MAHFALSTTYLVRRFGKVMAVDRLCLKVPLGSVYGFLGPNGAGKTTTIRMLLGLIQPDAGEVFLFGEPLRPNRRRMMRRVGALVESPSLYSHLTGRENLEVTCRLLGSVRQEIGRTLQFVGLKEAADRKVKGYSQGMRQRLALALALLNDPELLIFDEPTNGLDPAGIQEMRALICRLPEDYGVTVFLSSHLLAEVEQVATHIGIIHKGKLCFEGALEDLHAQVEGQVVVGVDRPDRAKRLLHQEGWAVQSNGGHRLTVAANGRLDAALLNAQLVDGGIRVHSLGVEKPNLEELFMMLTQSPEGTG